MKRWIAALSLAFVAVLGMGIWGYGEYNSRQMLQTSLGNNYQRAFYNLSDHVQSMEVLLGKSLIATGSDQSKRLFNQIWQQSKQASDSLTQLPVEDEILGRTAKFITQLGDYTNTLSEQVGQGKPVKQEQWSTMNQLYAQVSDLNKALGDIHNQVADGSFNFYELALNGTRRLSQEGPKLASSNFQGIDQGMQKYPTLIYDGPFSDHLEQGKSRGVTGEKINESKAKSIALQYYDNKNKEKPVVQVIGNVESNIPAYRVEIAHRKGGKDVGEPTIADISQKGGHIIWMITPRDIAAANWNIEKARDRAEEYLKDHGYKSIKSSYYQRNDHTVTFNYASMEDDVIIYPDLLKVTVALDDGQVVGFDARGYLMSHHKRNLPKPQLSEDMARAFVSDRLEVEDKGRLALIPIGVEKERLTWEFKGTLGQETYLVYINAQNGEEENVLKLILTSDAQLTM